MLFYELFLSLIHLVKCLHHLSFFAGVILIFSRLAESNCTHLYSLKEGENDVLGFNKKYVRLKNCRWISIASMSVPRYGAAAVYDDDNLWIFGGTYPDGESNY